RGRVRECRGLERLRRTLEPRDAVAGGGVVTERGVVETGGKGQGEIRDGATDHVDRALAGVADGVAVEIDASVGGVRVEERRVRNRAVGDLQGVGAGAAVEEHALRE